MLDPLEILRDEHELLGRRLERIEGFLPFPRLFEADASAASIFARLLLAHMEREDRILFPSVAGLFGRAGGPLHVLRREHDQLSRLSAELPDAIRAREARRVHDIAEHLGTLMRDHLEKEERVVFRAVDSNLPRYRKRALSIQLQKLVQKAAG